MFRWELGHLYAWLSVPMGVGASIFVVKCSKGVEASVCVVKCSEGVEASVCVVK